MSNSMQEIVKNNEKSTSLDTIDLLLRIVENILREPQSERFRRIKISGKEFERKIMPVAGAFSYLLELGFIENEDCLTLPASADLEKLRAARTELSIARSQLSGSAASSSSHAANQPSGSRSRPQQVVVSRETERQFIEQLRGYVAKVRRYEDAQLQRQALSKIPLERLKKTAEERFAKYRTGVAADSILADREVYLVQELAKWFKEEFFSWFNKPDQCQVCGSTQFGAANKQGIPTAEDLMYGGSRVEVFVCDNGHEERFVRYNEPSKLLETRKGRCGEWANTFGLVLRACGFQTRLVYDSTDHLWNEVYSATASRWLHVDASECKLDAPALYEAGWGKQLQYILAFSCDDLQDVTWRYVRTRNWPATWARRNLCSERALLRFILRERAALQAGVSSARRKELAARCLAELAQFVAKQDAEPAAEELDGRLSGSLEWRVARGEAGSAPESESVGHSFLLATSEQLLASGGGHFRLTVRYDCVRDQYETVRRRVDAEAEETIGADETLQGYKAGTFRLANTCRKLETDWKMVYVCRQEGSPPDAVGELVWHFELGRSEQPLAIDQVRVFVQHAVFDNGSVEWSLSDSLDHGRCHAFPGGFHSTDTFKGCRSVYLRAKLLGGTGNCAWQHAQLFRQKLMEQNRPGAPSTRLTGSPFEVCIDFKTT